MSSFGRSVCRKMYGILVVIYGVVHERRTTDHDIEKCHLKGCLGRHRDSLYGLKPLHLSVLSDVISLSYCSRCHVGKSQHEATISFSRDHIHIHPCSDTIIIVTRVCSANVTLSVQFSTYTNNVCI